MAYSRRYALGRMPGAAFDAAFRCYAHHLHTSRHRKTHETPNNKTVGVGTKACRCLRIGRRIAPCLLCVDTCAVCHRLRAYVSFRSVRSRYTPLHSATLRSALTYHYATLHTLRQRHRRGFWQSLILLRNTIATTQADTPQYTAMPILRSARAFCAYS